MPKKMPKNWILHTYGIYNGIAISTTGKSVRINATLGIQPLDGRNWPLIDLTDFPEIQSEVDQYCSNET